MLTIARYYAAALFLIAAAFAAMLAADSEGALSYYNHWQAADDAGRVTAVCTILRGWFKWSSIAAFIGFAFSLAMPPLWSGNRVVSRGLIAVTNTRTSQDDAKSL